MKIKKRGNMGGCFLDFAFARLELPVAKPNPALSRATTAPTSFLSTLLGRVAVSAVAGALSLTALGMPARAQSQWDSVISDSHWYVTVPQMLAYGSSATSFANPFPVGDQTLWTLGTSTDGVFSGTTSAELAMGPVTTTSSMNIQGVVTASGQITMLFTDPATGLVTVGLGVMREEDGVSRPWRCR